MHFLMLILGTVLLPKVYTLKCFECIPGTSGTCTQTERECPDRTECASARLITYLDGSEVVNIKIKTCALSQECNNGSVNFGIARDVYSTKCCSTDLCNSQDAPVISISSQNGKKCFYCDGQECTKTLNCMGNEDYCISASVDAGGGMVTVKGCASKMFCSNSQTAQTARLLNIGCCQGDFCNSASSTSVSLLLLVAPLIFLVSLS